MNTKVITGKARMSYVHVFEPYAMEEGQEKKYMVSILIPKDDTKTIAKIKSAVEAAKEEGKSRLSKNGKMVKKWSKNVAYNGPK